MPHISKDPLNKKIRAEIEMQLRKVLLKSSDGAALFGELLTEVEQVMIAKRLAAILMLIDDQSYYRIEQTLGMSVSTSKRLHQSLVGGAFEALERKVASKREQDQLLASIGTLLRAGLPPRHYVIKKRN